MKTGIELIADERARQASAEGWDERHDDEHTDESLSMAAACYALPDPCRGAMRRTTREERDVALRGECPVWKMTTVHYDVPELWPDSWHPSWWKPKDRIRDLVRAGALIAAEIDRLQRLEHSSKEPSK